MLDFASSQLRGILYIMLTPPSALEALLFASGEAMEKRTISKLLDVSEEDLSAIILVLSEILIERGITLIETETKLELRTAPQAYEIVKTLRESEFSKDLGKAGLETLAIIIYRKGATRSEIDWIRGVNSSATVRSLSLRGLIEGKEDSIDRRRIRYQATPDALAYLGVSKSEDLPQYAEFSQAIRETETEQDINNS